MGRPYKIGTTHEAVLLEIVRSNDFATMGEVKAQLQRRTGLEAHEQTILKALLRLGVERRKGSGAVEVHKEQAGSKRYGYTDQHRNQTEQQRFFSCLTDHEWALVEDIFAGVGRTSTRPFGGGVIWASLSRCTTACGPIGANAQVAQTPPRQRCSMPNRPGFHHKAARAALMQARK